MITAKTRVSDALAQRPELRDRLPAFHPAFERLRHPILGRLMPRLVTVAEAARVAGVDPEVLVAVMNLPLDQPLPSAVLVRPPDKQAPAWLDPARIHLLDVRPLLASGQDPLTEILGALRRLPEGGQLQVVAPFEPVPLMGLLARQGWQHWVCWEGTACKVIFAHTGQSASPTEPLMAVAQVEAGGWSLDVRALEPPEPMRAVLAALDAGQLPLRILHRREPLLLYPKLSERGLAWKLSEEGGEVEIRVYRP